jgi:hypothetical protein
MAWSKQGAFGMLVAVVLWTAAPLIACVPGFGPKPKADCCAAMMQDCGGSAMSGSCCELAPAHTTAATVSAFAPEHDQHPATIVRGAYLSMPANPGTGQQIYHETPPPDPSPGSFSILRI